jgi:serine/threonine protein kinase
VDYIKERLRSPQGIVDEANLKLQSVDPDVRKIILRCLVVDPQKRSTCNELLKDDYFQCKSPDLETNAVE